MLDIDREIKVQGVREFYQVDRVGVQVCCLFVSVVVYRVDGSRVMTGGYSLVCSQQDFLGFILVGVWQDFQGYQGQVSEFWLLLGSMEEESRGCGRV